MTDKPQKPIVDRLDDVLGKFAPTDALATELVELKNVIETLRNQIKTAQPEAGVHVPAMTDELDLVVAMTERATFTIMECCESVLNSLQDIDRDLYHQVETDIIRIYEACTFQDITGQRIRKVASSLKKVDTQVNSLLRVLSSDTEQHEEPGTEGPSLPQAEIDDLMSNLGKQAE